MAERADDGFTIIEVVIVVVVLGLISLVMGFAITTVLRVTPVAESQVHDARSLQGLTAWFANDAASAERSAASVRQYPDLSADGVACTNVPTEGFSLVEFQWTTDEPAATTFVAVYRIEPDGDSSSIKRYECSGSGAAPHSGTVEQKLTGPLAPTATVTTTPGFDRITLGLEALDGTPITVEATPRNTSVTLPPSTTPPSLAPPSPPVPCSVVFDSPVWGPASRWVTPGGLNKLLTATTLTMTISGETCGTITIEYNTGVEDRSEIVTWSGSSGSVTWLKGYDYTPDAEWDAGSHTISVYNNCPSPCASPPLDTSVVDVL